MLTLEQSRKSLRDEVDRVLSSKRDVVHYINGTFTAPYDGWYEIRNDYISAIQDSIIFGQGYYLNENS